MMKVIGFFCLLLVVAVSPAPTTTTTRNPAIPDDCSKECLNAVGKFGQDLTILKHPNFSKYFNQIDEICDVITTARSCLEKCGHTTTASNPFSLESLNIMCQPKAQEKIAVIKQCLKYVDSSITEVCSKECSPESIIDETTTPKMDPIVQAANKNCATYKCMARCNVEVTADQCGKEIGSALEGLLQQVVDTQRKELEMLNLVEAMTKSAPPECNYMYDPSVLFGEKSEEQQTPAATPATKEDAAKAIYAQAQLQLLLKQLELIEKQDHLIERENTKLDMEMSYMANKAVRAQQQQAIPAPKAMDFPHPMPLEVAVPEQQQQQPQKRSSMPMEFVPLEAMFMPLEAMPRFL